MTNLAIDFALYDDHPLNLDALRLAISSGQRWLGDRLVLHGNDWLSPTDNPFTSSIHGRCFIRIDSLKAPGGRSRMTYRTVLDIYDAYEEVFIAQGNAAEGAVRMSVAGIIVGHGAVTVEDPAPGSVRMGVVS